MTKIAIDPISRIEGHLRIEVELQDNKIVKAWSSSTMFRGFEKIMIGRDPREAWAIAQRICGVCTTVHALASVRAVEDSLGITIPTNARIIRNLIAGIQYVQDHVIHFYHLHALDWVDIVNALKADPEETSRLAQSISDWPQSSTAYFKGIQQRLKTFAESGQLGFLNNGYWGHPAYQLPPEANLMAAAHYLEALDWQREVIKIHALLGSKNPHPQTYLVGGMACPVDPDSPVAINAQKLAQIDSLLTKAQDFVKRVYYPDVLAVGQNYLDWAGTGEGLGNFLCYGDFALKDQATQDDLLFPAGVILDRNLAEVQPFDAAQISEAVTHSWYTYTDGQTALHPSVGQTSENYDGPRPPYEFLNTDGKYSWLKAPRYGGHAMEVGPLSRMLIGYALGRETIKAAVDETLGRLNAPLEALYSTLGRTAARCIETVVMADQLKGWNAELAANIGSGDLRIHDNSLWDPSTWPADSAGWGAVEAPRGSLGHWIHIQDGKVANYQAVVPTTWNASPRDDGELPGAYEAALEGLTIADPSQPVEILRTIHSFDPCMACAVHLLDASGVEVSEARIPG